MIVRHSSFLVGHARRRWGFHVCFPTSFGEAATKNTDTRPWFLSTFVCVALSTNCLERLKGLLPPLAQRDDMVKLSVASQHIAAQLALAILQGEQLLLFALLQIPPVPSAQQRVHHEVGESP